MSLIDTYGFVAQSKGYLLIDSDPKGGTEHGIRVGVSTIWKTLAQLGLGPKKGVLNSGPGQPFTAAQESKAVMVSFDHAAVKNERQTGC